MMSGLGDATRHNTSMLAYLALKVCCFLAWTGVSPCKLENSHSRWIRDGGCCSRVAHVKQYVCGSGR